jgi:hypothetical protein
MIGGTNLSEQRNKSLIIWKQKNHREQKEENNLEQKKFSKTR